MKIVKMYIVRVPDDTSDSDYIEYKLTALEFYDVIKFQKDYIIVKDTDGGINQVSYSYVWEFESILGCEIAAWERVANGLIKEWGSYSGITLTFCDEAKEIERAYKKALAIKKSNDEIRSSFK